MNECRKASNPHILREPIKSRFMLTVKIIQFHNFDRILFGTHFVLSILLAAIVNFERPSLASSDTDKFKFPNMVSDKCPSTLSLLSHGKPTANVIFLTELFWWFTESTLAATFWYIDNVFIV